MRRFTFSLLCCYPSPFAVIHLHPARIRHPADAADNAHVTSAISALNSRDTTSQALVLTMHLEDRGSRGSSVIPRVCAWGQPERWPTQMINHFHDSPIGPCVESGQATACSGFPYHTEDSIRKLSYLQCLLCDPAPR